MNEGWQSGIKFERRSKWDIETTCPNCGHKFKTKKYKQICNFFKKGNPKLKDVIK